MEEDLVTITVKLTVNRSRWATEYGLPDTDRAVREDLYQWLRQLAGNDIPIYVSRAR